MASTSTSGEECYTSTQHGTKVVGGFERLWRESLMCDTTLVAESKSFKVHRSYLAACSHYFHAMFTEGFRESEQNQVVLEGVSAAGLQTLLQYAYTGQVGISQTNLQNVLEAAAHLQFHEVLEFCAEYVRDRLTIDNCLHFLEMAEMYELSSCKTDTKRFILENFVSVAQNDAFLDISFELLCEFLKDDRLRADSELDVFNVAVKWLENYNQPEAKAKEVLELIRYGLMSAEEMETVYGNTRLLSENCRPVLQQALNYHLRLFTQPINKTAIARMRASIDSMVVLGAGKTDNTLCRNLMAAKFSSDSKIEEFQQLSPLKHPRYFSAVVVLNNFVFVVGGQTAMAGDGTHATNTAFRYNARDGKWLQISSMNVPRTYFSLVALEDCLLAVGGKHNRVAVSSAEKYTFSTNEWTSVASLPNTLFSHAGTSHNNLMYVSGGCPGENFTNHVHCYDPVREAWQRCSPMNVSRGYHTMISHNDKIYVCAGNTNAGHRADVLHVEIYCPETDQWTMLMSISQGQSEAPAVFRRDRVYILGGYSWNGHSFQDIVQCYNIEDDEWSVLELRLPESMTGALACCVQLPLKLYDKYSTAAPNET